MPALSPGRVSPLAAVLLFALLAMLQNCAWVWLSLLTGRLCGAMALALAAAAVLALRWGGMPASPARAAWAMLATAGAAALACWLVLAAQVGLDLGVNPLASALRLGPHLALTLLRLAASGWDIAALLASPLLAGLGAFGRRRR